MGDRSPAALPEEPVPHDDAAWGRPARLGIGVVGAGRVGAVLGRALADAGHSVLAVSGISKASRERANALLPGVPVLAVQDVVERAELVLLAVPDDALGGLVSGLADVGAWQPGQIVVHTSGRFGAQILGPAAGGGAIPLAIHPAMTFTGTAVDLARLSGATFAVTAAQPALPIGQALVVEMGGEPVVIEEGNRALYHAGLAHGANHLVTLIAQAAQALAAAGVAQPGRALTPLLAAALDNAVRCADKAVEGGPGAIDALTGPVARGDSGTVAEHLRAFRQLGITTGATDTEAAYRVLSRGAARRALGAHLIDDAAVGRLLDILDEP